MRRQLRLAGRDEEATPWLAPWTPFQQVKPYLASEKRLALIQDIIDTARTAKGVEVSWQQAAAIVDEKQDVEMWQNSRYCVLVFRNEPPRDDGPQMIHLSIRRNDRKRPREERYRDFQRIKNELIGKEYEGCELYPADDRVADCADQYHIYVLADPALQFPFGFRDGLRAGPSDDSPAVQSPFED
jgi:hypothetical protein